MLGRAVAALLALTACDNSRWINTHATQLHVGPWVADIPEHWRDIHELREPPKDWGVPGGRTLLYESERGRGQIEVFPIMSVHDGEDCKAFAELVRQKTKGTAYEMDVSREEAATFAGDPGCLMHLSLQRTSGLLAIRTHGGHAVAVRCLGIEASLTGGGGCDKVVYSLHIGP